MVFKRKFGISNLFILALLNALDKNWIDGAILDVVPQEPLPSTSLLWTRSSVTITPHVGGISFSSTVLESFIEEFDALVAGESPATAVNWKEEY